jgi:glycosyltransferase involved in cell wall biosynthesis
LWQEPAGLTVIEALAYGCALITTDKGGIPEIARGRAEIAPIRELDYLDENNRKAIITILAANLHSLLSDNNKLARLQDRAWKDYPFDARNMAVNADKYRISLKS